MRRWAVVCGGALALVCVMGAAGAIDARFDAVTHFAPLLAAAALAALVWAAMVRAALVSAKARPWALAPAGTALGLCLAAMAPEALAPKALAPAERPPPDAPAYTLVSFNTWYANREVAAAEAWLRALDPEIIVLAEAVPALGLRQRLADRWPHEASAACAACGTAILSRWPIVARRDAGSDNLIVATLAAPEGDIDVIATHLAWPLPAARKTRQLARLAEAARSLGPRSLIAGDLNATPWSFALKGLDRAIPQRRVTRALPTWPAGAAALPIDHVFAGEAVAVLAVRRGPGLGSDHHPVVTRFALRRT